MATDMVVVPKPFILESYQDIIDAKQAVPYFFKEVTEYQFFKNSRKGSTEKRLWEEALKRTNNGSETELFVKFDQGNQVMDIFKRSLRKEALMITNKLWIPSAKQVLCNLRGNEENTETMIWASYDPSMTKFPKMNAFRQTMPRTPFHKRAEHRSRWSAEAFLASFITKHMDGKSSVFPPTLKYQEMSKCTSETLIMETPVTQSVLVTNFDLLIHTCLTLFLISSIALIIEVVIYRVLL